MKGCWEAVGRSKNADLRKGRQKVDSPQTNKNLNSALLMSVSFKQETTIKITVRNKLFPTTTQKRWKSVYLQYWREK